MMESTDELIEIREGKAILVVPNPAKFKREDGIFEPSWAPVFYNPRMMFNRDISVAALSAYHKTYCPKPTIKLIDLLSATGVRAIRYALESSGVEKAYANDKNPRAVKLIEENIRKNGVDSIVEPLNYEANYAALYVKNALNEPILYVDIDPYGSPLPFMDNSLRLVGHRGMLGFTATDMAPIVGSRIRAGLRRYYSLSGKTPFSKELALRILIGATARMAGVHEKGIKPLLAFYKDYYARIFLLVERGAGKADKSITRLGYLMYSPSTGYTCYTSGPVPSECGVDPYTGEKLRMFGPLWTGPLGDPVFMEKTTEEIQGLESPLEAIEFSFIKEISDEYTITNKPPYRLDHCARILNGQMPRPSRVAEALEEMGYRAVVSYLDPQSLRTNAPVRDVFYVCRDLVR
jgi:tRNA (guanine26-N2/guanine27-N2)-dimethyltransferase